MKLITILFVLLFPVSAICAPFLVCDPQATVTYYKITGDGYWMANVPAQVDGSIRSDLSTISIGTHNIQICACKTDVIWGEECSSTIPFTFTKPSLPSVPAGTKLVTP